MSSEDWSLRPSDDGDGGNKNSRGGLPSQATSWKKGNRWDQNKLVGSLHGFPCPYIYGCIMHLRWLPSFTMVPLVGGQQRTYRRLASAPSPLGAAELAIRNIHVSEATGPARHGSTGGILGLLWRRTDLGAGTVVSEMTGYICACVCVCVNMFQPLLGMIEPTNYICQVR